MNLAPVIRGITCPPSPSITDVPVQDGWMEAMPGRAPGGLHHSSESPRPTVSRIIRSAQIYDKSLLPRGSLDGKGAPLPSTMISLSSHAGNLGHNLPEMLWILL